MTSAVLQVVAILTMAIDHIGFMFFPEVLIFRMIGRISFPLFVFLLVEGYVHTRDRVSYFCRLLLFSVISEFAYELFSQGNVTGPYNQNVMFELSLIFVVLWLVDKGVEKSEFLFMLIGFLTLFAELLGFMYGAYGLLLGLCFYIFRNKRWAVMLSVLVLTVVYCVFHGSIFEFWAILSVIFIYFYNGERGRRMPRLLPYVFYPGHLLVLEWIHFLWL